jgi:hypothetical protein
MADALVEADRARATAFVANVRPALAPAHASWVAIALVRAPAAQAGKH